MLLVGEERGERVGGRRTWLRFPWRRELQLLRLEETVYETDYIREIGAPDGVANFIREADEVGLILRGVTLDGGGEVLVAEMQHGEADVLALLGDAGAQLGAAEGDLAAARGEDLMRVAVDVEAEELAIFGGSCERWS